MHHLATDKVFHGPIEGTEDICYSSILLSKLTEAKTIGLLEYTHKLCWGSAEGSTSFKCI